MDNIVVSGVGKRFRRYHADRPATIQEAVAKGLRRRRRVETFWALRDVSLEIGAGKTVGLIGSNGSGKSTLLRLIGGVGQPDTGHIDVKGRIGALLDLGAGFHPDLTGRENAVLAGILNGLTRRQVLDRLEAIVEFAEIAKALDNPIRTYSSGMQMRLAFSVAVHTEPEILLIDEVLAVGDISFQRKCLARIDEFKAAGCTILLVSHVGKTVENLCDEAIWLNNGRLMAMGETRGIVAQYASHMDPDGQDSEKDTQDDSYPVAAPPPITIRTLKGKEVVIDDRRFGSQELEIASVRVLDSGGRPVNEIASGDPVRIELDYVAHESIVAPVFSVRIDREDGVKVCGLNALAPPMKMLALKGNGRVAVQIERLDLNTGRYKVSVVCYTQDWAYAYDHQTWVSSFTVRGSSPPEVVLDAPCTWEIVEGS